LTGLRKWWLKAAIQGGVSILPGRLPETVNGRLQALGSGGAALTDTTLATKFRQAEHHLEAWRRFGPDETPPRVLEVGTGWFPVVPLVLYLHGVAGVDSYDIRQLTGPSQVRQTVAGVLRARTTSSPRPVAARVEQLEQIARAADDAVLGLLEAAGVRFHTGRITPESVAADAFDLAVSDNTLEHVPPAQLDDLSAAMARSVRPGGVVDHFVDGSDHYAHFDRGISEYNFLRWNDLAWSLINNRLLYQNRLREADYGEILTRAGLPVVASEWSAGRPREVAALPLAERFRTRPVGELAPLRGFVTATVRALPDAGRRAARGGIPIAE
jgi:SAM-dependent methyltransferase